MRQILLVTLDGTAPAVEDMTALRDYVVESVGRGVLVLGRGTTVELMEAPDMPAIEISTQELLMPSEEAAPASFARCAPACGSTCASIPARW